MVHYMDHDYMVQNINEYIEDVYIYKHMAKLKNNVSFLIKKSLNLFAWYT
jgi:hypothetical protein